MSIQDELSFSLESSEFPCDRLDVHKLRGREAIGQLYAFEIEVIWRDHDGPSRKAMTGARVTLVMERLAGPGKGWHGIRKVHGVLAEVEDLLATHADVRTYRLLLVPRAIALAMVETQDLLVQLSVPEILQRKLDAVDLGSETELRLRESYPKRELVVEYKESDLAFVARLAEHLGVSFFFQHGDDHDTLVFTDHAGGFAPVDGAEEVPFRSHAEERGVFELTAKQRIVPAYYAVRDYNYRTPLLDITGDHEIPDAFAGGIIEYGAHHKTPAEAKALAKVRAEERLAGELVYTGKSAVPALRAGMRVRVTDHPDEGALDLLIVDVEHDATFVVGAKSQDDAPGYVNTFRAIPADRTYRPPRRTPRPRISGVVTGIIDAGAHGVPTLARIDEQGRYLVRFLFDTTPAGDRQDGRPVRMVQNHAGEAYGTHFPLKPGTEVVIGFVDGDPDRPLILGAVPNPIKPSPVTNANPGLHRIKTSTGITVDMQEAAPSKGR